MASELLAAAALILFVKWKYTVSHEPPHAELPRAAFEADDPRPPNTGILSRAYIPADRLYRQLHNSMEVGRKIV